MKFSKLQMLTTKFKNIKKKEDEAFTEFYTKLSNIVNSCYNLGERILESMVIKKIILRLLPKRFRPKVAVIVESQNVDSMRLVELVGSL